MADKIIEMGRPKKTEPTKQVRLPQSLAKRIARMAIHLGKDPGDYVAERIGPALDRDEKKMIEEIGRGEAK